MGRLSGCEAWDDSSVYESDYDPYGRDRDLRANPRDEYLTRVYIEGRNAARAHKPRTVQSYYDSDTLAAINWETGYDDYLCEQEGNDTL